MARISGLNAKKRHNRTLNWQKATEGRSKQYREYKTVCNESSLQALCRKKNRRNVSSDSLDPARINAAARMNGLSYSKNDARP